MPTSVLYLVNVICFKKRNVSTIKQRICSSSCNSGATVL